MQYFSSTNNQHKWKINSWLEHSFAEVKKNPKTKTNPKLERTGEVLESSCASSHHYLKQAEKKSYQNKNRNQLSVYEQTLNYKQIVSKWVQPRGKAHSSSHFIPTWGEKVGSSKNLQMFFQRFHRFGWTSHLAQQREEPNIAVTIKMDYASGKSSHNEDIWGESPQRMANPTVSPAPQLVDDKTINKTQL